MKKTKKIKLNDNDKKIIRTEAVLELCRRDFWFFCHTLYPKFYKKKRKHLIDLCGALQDFYLSDNEVLVINMPPRFGKSFTLQLFCTWIMQFRAHVMIACYNEKLSTRFARTVRNIIQTEKAQQADCQIFSDVFNDVKIQRGAAAANLWGIEGSYDNFLACSPGGTATGFGASLIIVDDIIKDAYEAFNKNILEDHWSWFSNTMLSRLEAGGKMIITATRWSSNDLSGMVLKEFDDVIHYCKSAYDEATGELLCEDLLNLDKYNKLKKRIKDKRVFEANYNQVLIDIQGQLYTKFNTYTDEDLKQLSFRNISAVCDTADEGSDWLCCIVFGETFDKKAYLLDVYYTKKTVEYTIPETAEFLKNNKINRVIIESNNGGKLFALSVQKEMREKLKFFPIVKWFCQTKNKEARINSSAFDAMNRIYMPFDWHDRWHEFSEDITEYQAEGQNEHDDAADALTMVLELMDGRLKTN